MKKINGVLGPINIEDLGYTLMHEHILSADWSMRIAFLKDWINYEEFIELAVAEVNMAIDTGIKTIVDATPIDLGRDVSVLREVAKRTGIQIIASTGLYYNETAMLKSQNKNIFLRWFMREIEEGMQGTDTKPGVIKVASDLAGITELNGEILKAAALANIKSGIPIYTHATSINKIGIKQQDIFERQGVNLRNVCIGHCGDCNDLEYMEKILKRGSYIGLDRFGHDETFKVFNLEKRIETLIELYKRGWIEKLIVSHDFVCYLDFFGTEWREMKNIDTNNLPFDFCYFNKKVVPILLKRDITLEEINTLIIKNPQSFFG